MSLYQSPLSDPGRLSISQGVVGNLMRTSQVACRSMVCVKPDEMVEHRNRPRVSDIVGKWNSDSKILTMRSGDLVFCRRGAEELRSFGMEKQPTKEFLMQDADDSAFTVFNGKVIPKRPRDYVSGAREIQDQMAFRMMYRFCGVMESGPLTINPTDRAQRRVTVMTLATVPFLNVTSNVINSGTLMTTFVNIKHVSDAERLDFGSPMPASATAGRAMRRLDPDDCVVRGYFCPVDDAFFTKAAELLQPAQPVEQVDEKTSEGKETQQGSSQAASSSAAPQPAGEPWPNFEVFGSERPTTTTTLSEETQSQIAKLAHSVVSLKAVQKTLSGELQGQVEKLKSDGGDGAAYFETCKEFYKKKFNEYNKLHKHGKPESDSVHKLRMLAMLQSTWVVGKCATDAPPGGYGTIVVWMK